MEGTGRGEGGEEGRVCWTFPLFGPFWGLISKLILTFDCFLQFYSFFLFSRFF